jgi:hypothetical protein
MPKMTVYLHASDTPPDFVTHDAQLIEGVAKKFGRHSSQLVFANELANSLRNTSIGRPLAETEDITMVRVEISA